MGFSIHPLAVNAAFTLVSNSGRSVDNLDPSGRDSDDWSNVVAFGFVVPLTRAGRYLPKRLSFHSNQK